MSETRPRSQGARLTAWELQNERHLAPDYCRQCRWPPDESGEKIDLVITGADRIAKNGDVANKVGTLEKAICAKEFGIPFYAAAPLVDFRFSGFRAATASRSSTARRMRVFFQSGPDEGRRLAEDTGHRA